MDDVYNYAFYLQKRIKTAEKLVGAVTHALVNDPTMGCGIFIENMLEAAG